MDIWVLDKSRAVHKAQSNGSLSQVVVIFFLNKFIFRSLATLRPWLPAGDDWGWGFMMEARYGERHTLPYWVLRPTAHGGHHLNRGTNNQI